jgi:hypothetical protein
MFPHKSFYMLIAASLSFQLIILTDPEMESEIFERSDTSDTDPEQITILRASAKHPITSNNKI